MRVRWEVEDGYSGKSRPQFTEIEDEDWLACVDDSERDMLIEEAVQEDFDCNMTWCVVGLERVPEEDEYRGHYK